MAQNEQLPHCGNYLFNKFPAMLELENCGGNQILASTAHAEGEYFRKKEAADLKNHLDN